MFTCSCYVLKAEVHRLPPRPQRPRAAFVLSKLFRMLKYMRMKKLPEDFNRTRVTCLCRSCVDPGQVPKYCVHNLQPSPLQKYNLPNLSNSVFPWHCQLSFCIVTPSLTTLAQRLQNKSTETPEVTVDIRACYYEHLVHTLFSIPRHI